MLSRLHLLEHAWDFAYENRSNVMEVYVGRLRRKIDEPFGRESLETVRGAGYRLAHRRPRMSRLPIRVRVAAAFALAMAVVLAATGVFLYLRLSSHLALAVERQLQLRAQDLAALVGQPGATLSSEVGGRLVERGESYAQLVAPSGRVLDATEPLGSTPLLTAGQVRAAARRPIYVDRSSVPGLDEPSGSSRPGCAGAGGRSCSSSEPPFRTAQRRSRAFATSYCSPDRSR